MKGVAAEKGMYEAIQSLFPLHMLQSHHYRSLFLFVQHAFIYSEWLFPFTVLDGDVRRNSRNNSWKDFFGLGKSPKPTMATQEISSILCFFI